MFQLTETTEARLATVTNRVEKHGDEDKPAVTLGLEITTANTILDLIDPKIREALFKPVEGQEDLPGVERSTPVLRCNAFDKHTLETSHEGWTLNVDDNIDESDPMVFGSVKVDRFSIDAHQGGSITLRFRAGTSDVDADKLGKLAMHNGQSIWITLTAPDPKADAIDGSKEAFEKDHPDAGELFGAAHGGPGESDSEGGDPDISDQPSEATGDDRVNWPFPGDSRPLDEVAPQSVRVEGTKRTKRGRDATAAFLAAQQGAAEEGTT
jgi:hypothetical protein